MVFFKIKEVVIKINTFLKERLPFRPIEKEFKKAYYLRQHPKQLTPDSIAFLKKLSDKYPLCSKLSSQLFLKNKSVLVHSHARYMPDNYHSHDFFEMIYVLSGTCQQIYRGTSYSLHTGDIAIMAPYTSHNIRVTNDETIVINILFRKEVLDQLLADLVQEQNIISEFLRCALYNERVEHQIIIQTGQDESLIGILETMYQENQNQKPLKNSLMISYLNMFFIQLIRSHLNDIKAVDTHANVDSDIIPILAEIQENFKTITLKDLSFKYHYTEAYLSKKIKAFTKHSFSEHINELRLQYACKLLQETDWPVDKVAKESGFFDLSHFSRHFKTSYGVAPGKYRKQAKENVQS